MFDKAKASVCQQDYKSSLAGAAMMGLGLEGGLMGVTKGLANPYVHLALAGIGTDLMCHWVPGAQSWTYNKTLLMDYQRLAKCGVAGIAGGMAMGAAMGVVGIGPILPNPVI